MSEHPEVADLLEDFREAVTRHAQNGFQQRDLSAIDEAREAILAAIKSKDEALIFIREFAKMRAADDKQVFTRVNRGALRTISTRADAALHQGSTPS